jgi:hypothetical protein
VTHAVTSVVNSRAWGWISTGLGVAGMLGCIPCGAASVGMSAISAAVTCVQGQAVSCGLNITSAVLGGEGMVFGKLGEVAKDAGALRKAARGFAPIQKYVTGPALGAAGSVFNGLRLALGWGSVAPSVASNFTSGR